MGQNHQEKKGIESTMLWEDSNRKFLFVLFHTHHKDGIDYITECSIVENISLWHWVTSIHLFEP